MVIQVEDLASINSKINLRRILNGMQTHPSFTSEVGINGLLDLNLEDQANQLNKLK